MSGVLSLFILIVCVGLFIFCSYKGLPPMVCAPLIAMLVLLTQGLDVYGGMTEAYMAGATGFLKKYFLMFMAGAVFANLMSASGAARSIGLALAKLARKFKGHEKYAALWCAVAIGFVITYGGVMIFVAFFTIIAIVKEMYKELDVPWRMYGVVPFGTAGLSMTMIPGSPSANNAVASGYLGTNAMSGPVLGLIAAFIACIVAHFYFSRTIKKIEASGEGFLPTGARIDEVKFFDETVAFKPINLFLALLPSIVLLIVLNVLNMGVTIACFAGIIVALIDFGLLKRFKSFNEVINILAMGVNQSIGAGTITALVIGFGSVVATTPGYAFVIGKLYNLGGPAELQIVLAVAIAAAVAGSPSGGLNIALSNLSEYFLSLGIQPAVIHRLSVIASGSLDSLPSCATLINELNQAKLTMKEGYPPQFVLITITPMVLCIILAYLSHWFGIC